MSLRQARFEDHWRAVFARKYAYQLTSVSFQNLYCLSDGTITFTGGINVIVGSNGVGKSTLLAAIAEVLANGEGTGDINHQYRVKGSTISATVLHSGKLLNLSIVDDPNKQRVIAGDTFDGEYRWLDPSTFAGRCLHQIGIEQNLPDLLEQVTPLLLDSDELAIVNYLVGKAYSSLSISEIVDYADFERFPYFKATAGGVTYGSEGMGRGELSLLLAYWTLRDIPKNSILVLEEPETHVSPKSQDCLMNIVAKCCSEKGIWIIITTHSPTVIRNIPSEHLRLLIRDNGPTTITDKVPKIDIALLLGGGGGLGGVLLVEDEAAKDFLSAMLEEFAPELSRQYEVAVTGSESGITSVLDNMPRTREGLAVIGVYDGDMRDKVKGGKALWPAVFLPGTVAPELYVLESFNSVADATGLLSEELRKTKEQITFAQNHAAGKDHHDYLIEVAKSLSLHPSVVRRGYTRVCFCREQFRVASLAFTNNLRAALNI